MQLAQVANEDPIEEGDDDVTLWQRLYIYFNKYRDFG